MTKEQINKFLEDYEALCIKHGAIIDETGSTIVALTASDLKTLIEDTQQNSYEYHNLTCTVCGNLKNDCICDEENALAEIVKHP